MDGTPPCRAARASGGELAARMPSGATAASQITPDLTTAPPFPTAVPPPVVLLLVIFYSNPKTQNPNLQTKNPNHSQVGDAAPMKIFGAAFIVHPLP